MQQQFFKQAVLGIALLVLGATGLAGTAVAGSDHYYHGHSHYGEHSRKHHKRYHRKYHHSDNYYRQRQRSQYRQQRRQQHRYYSDHGYSHHYDKHGRPYYQHDRQRGNRHHLNDNRRHNRHYDEHYSKPVKPHRSQQQCVTYSVKAIGGMGGFRFQHNIKDFKRLDKHGYKGKVCGRENVEIELSKLDPAVKVVLKIDGKRFVYGAHSGHDRHINNWHRKYYSLNFNLGGHDY